MRFGSRMSALAVAIVAAITLPVVATSTATAAPVGALATCDDYTIFSYNTSYRVFIPSIGHATAATNCTLALGSSGAGVYVLQDALRRCYGQNIAQDAQYGSATRQAVKNVQAFHGLSADGVYGPNTRNAMAFAKYLPNGGAYVGCWI